jgi:hypothetical protein
MKNHLVALGLLVLMSMGAVKVEEGKGTNKEIITRHA